MSGPRVPVDQPARERIRNDLDHSLVVEAAAGTGKTTELVNRLVGVLLSGRTEVDRVVAVTFTRKAAGELKLRLRQELDRARGRTDDPAQLANLERALARLEEARIGTIHAFCDDLLRARPVEAGVDPAFRMLDENAGPALYRRTFERWIQHKLADLPAGLSRALNRATLRHGPPGETPMDQLAAAGLSLVEWRDFTTAWRREPYDRDGQIDALLPEVRALAALRERGRSQDTLYRSLAPATDLATWVERAEREAPRDHDRLEARLMHLLASLERNTWTGQGKLYAEGLPRDEVLAARQALIDRLEGFATVASADLASRLQEELRELVDAYEQAKRRAGLLDFTDLLIRARDLLRDNAEVRAYFQQRFTHVFVDEFQDTDPLQAEILLLLAADDPAVSEWEAARPVPGKLFLVGDPKQSIYRFRRADVVFYQRVCSQLERCGVAKLQLSCSFRSVPAIQQAVNAGFEGQMTGDRESGQPDYVPLQPWREPLSDQPSVVALPVPWPYGWRGAVTNKAIEESLPAAVGGLIEWLIDDSDWRVSDPDDPAGSVPIGPQHICILFRRFSSWGKDATREYARQLEIRRIPHVLVGSRSFHQREEVETVRAALCAVEWPDDELNVFATLRGALFSLTDEQLLCFQHTVGALHPFRRLPDALDAALVPVAEALAILARLHRERNDRPVVETVNALLEQTRAHAGLALRTAGNQVLANVQRICDRARAYELAGGISFRGFVEALVSEAEQGPTQLESPVLAEGAEEVRLMTVHKAKGLEFPVVILADLTCKQAPREPSRHVDQSLGLAAMKVAGCMPWELIERAELETARERAETVRVAYVAATRARDLLVVPAVGERPHDGWLEPLGAALYPERAGWRQAAAAPRCPEFGTSSAVKPAPDSDPRFDPTVRPGLHRPARGSHRVVWWDPCALRLNVDPSYGLLHEHVLIENDAASRAMAEQGRRAHGDWLLARDRALERGGVTDRAVTTVTAAAQAGQTPAEPVVRCERLSAGERARPGGRRFGSLVHSLLRDAPLDAEREVVERLARLAGRVLGAPAEERDAAVEAVIEVLAHPLLRRAASAIACHREWPVVMPDPAAERLVEGVIDLAFEEADGWVVVDFKVTADLAVHQPLYEAQLAWYAYAVASRTGAPVTSVLLGV